MLKDARWMLQTLKITCTCTMHSYNDSALLWGGLLRSYRCWRVCR